MGNGDGTFQVCVDYSSGRTPTSVAIGDLDGDGDKDLATSNYEHTASVFLGIGDGVPGD